MKSGPWPVTSCPRNVARAKKPGQLATGYGLQTPQLLRRVRRRVDLRMRLRDDAVLVDHVRDAARVDIFRRVGRSVGDADLAIGVAEQREGKVELLGERFVLVLRVETDADDLRVLRFVLDLEVPEPGTFPRSTRGVGLRIKPEDDFLSSQIAEPDVIAVVIDGVELGRFLADLEHACPPSEDHSQNTAYGHASIVE